MDQKRYCTLDGEYVAQYCSPSDVARAIRMIDYNDPNGGIWEPSDSTIPSWDDMIFRICAKEEEFDAYTNRSWRVNRVKDHVTSMNTYWHDLNSQRSEFWVKGGYTVQLHSHVLPWDPAKGDRLYLRNYQNNWMDVTDQFCTDPNRKDGGTLGWIDYDQGTAHIITSYLKPKQDAVKITYRWGSEEPVPALVSRCVALMTALTLLNEDLYMTRLGQGGDLGGQKNDMKRAMQDEINSIIAVYRTTTSVYSLYQ